MTDAHAVRTVTCVAVTPRAAAAAAARRRHPAYTPPTTKTRIPIAPPNTAPGSCARLSPPEGCGYHSRATVPAAHTLLRWRRCQRRFYTAATPRAQSSQAIRRQYERRLGLETAADRCACSQPATAPHCTTGRAMHRRAAACRLASAPPPLPTARAFPRRASKHRARRRKARHTSRAESTHLCRVSLRSARPIAGASAPLAAVRADPPPAYLPRRPPALPRAPDRGREER